MPRCSDTPPRANAENDDFRILEVSFLLFVVSFLAEYRNTNRDMNPVDAPNIQSYTFEEIRIRHHHSGDNVDVIINGESGEGVALVRAWQRYSKNDLRTAFERPNVRIEKLSINVQNDEVTEQLETMLADLGRPLYVKCFEFLSQDDPDIVSPARKQLEVMGILQYLQPGTLEKLEFYCDSPMDVERIAETPQWTQATYLITNFRINVPVERLTNFNRIDTFTRGITSENVIALRQAFFQNPNFKFCHLHENEGKITKGLVEELRNEGFNYFDGHFHVYICPTKVVFLNRN